MPTVDYSAEQVFLKFVKDTLEAGRDDSGTVSPSGAVCVLANAAAVEALANRYFIYLDRLPEFDQLKTMSKIAALGKLAGNPIDWGRPPWQQVAKLIRVRNWLAHYKESRGNSEPVGVAGHDPNKFDPSRDLTGRAIRSYYDGTREGFAALAQMLGIPETEYGYLVSERYEPPA
jgi:hypothetical protein